MLTGRSAEATRRAAVLGSPIAHSLSPALHNAAYRALGLRHWSYASADVDAGSLPAHLAALDTTWRGLSLTMPLKQAALELAHTVSTTARATGAVNTLVRDERGWSGENTDVHGILAALSGAGVLALRHGVVIGSGATARSTVAAFARLGATRVTFMVRGPARPEAIAQARAAGLEVEEVGIGDWPAQAEVLVSTVPPEALAAVVDRLPTTAAVLLDVVYGAGHTPLMHAGVQRGYAVVPGTELLLHQAAEQVRLMTGEQPPLPAMRAALVAAVSERDGR